MSNEIATYRKEISELTSDKESFKRLLSITFNGLSQEMAMTSMLEGRMNGFTLQNFFKKDVYAIPFKQGYSLVTSIDYNRKIGQKSGVVGISSPIYVEEETELNGKKIVKIKTCEITVKKLVDGTVGEFSSLVYFDEYYKSNQYKNSLWDTKPRTMIAKVAEMQALRKACPEELAKAYIEEEYEKETIIAVEETEKKEEKEKTWKQKMEECKTVDELGKVWADMPGMFKSEVVIINYKNELKAKLTPLVEGEIAK